MVCLTQIVLKRNKEKNEVHEKYVHKENKRKERSVGY